MTNFFPRKNGILHGENVSLMEIIDHVPTPFYCYALNGFKNRYEALQNAFAGHSFSPRIAYAVKANGHLPCLRILADLNASADIVSMGELARCLKAGIKPENIIFSGVGKTKDDIREALRLKIGQFNIESKEELNDIAIIAQETKQTVNLAIRVNPDIHAPTHDKIATARRSDKFGVLEEDVPSLLSFIKDHAYLHWSGLAIHIGSQIFAHEFYERALSYLLALDKLLVQKGLPPSPQFDLGGGLGSDHQQEIDINRYAHLMQAIDRPFIIEPGRFIAAPAGILVSRVIRVKKSHPHDFVILDAAMNDLLRPALYEAEHPIITIGKPRTETMSAHVVGGICESGDTFLKATTIPFLKEGDYVALTHCGAYGAVMASCYNGRPLIGEVSLQNDQWSLTRPPLTITDSIASELIPSWMTS